MLKFNAKVGEWGPGLRFKSRIFRICLLYLRKDTSRGYTCLSGHFFLVFFLWAFSLLIRAVPGKQIKGLEDKSFNFSWVVAVRYFSVIWVIVSQENVFFL